MLHALSQTEREITFKSCYYSFLGQQWVCFEEGGGVEQHKNPAFVSNEKSYHVSYPHGKLQVFIALCEGVGDVLVVTYTRQIHRP